MRKIAVINSKGGTGKTTTVVNLGAGLASRGKKVLIVDLDSQGHIGVWFDINPSLSLYHILSQGEDPKRCVVTVRKNLDVIPSDRTLVKTKQDLVSMPARERALKRALKGMVDNYDYLLLDCAPSMDIITHNALVLAEEIFIPVSMDYLALVGVRQILEDVELFNEVLEQETKISLVIPTFYDLRNRKSKETLPILKRHFGERMTDPIRINVVLARAPANKKTIFEYDNHSRGAKDYRKLVDLIISQ